MTNFLNQPKGKLSNNKFLDNAPAEVIEKEKEKLNEFIERKEKIDGYIAELRKE